MVDEFCQEEGLPILMRIPFKRSIAEGIAMGKSLIEIEPEYKDRFIGLFSKIENAIKGKGYLYDNGVISR
jgi:MinD superfamily P-loop ATPase